MAVEFTIEKRGAVIEEQRNGWSLEINKVSWNGKPAKWDIRSWNKDHTEMRKGLTLSDKQLKSLHSVITNIVKSGRKKKAAEEAPTETNNTEEISAE